MKKVTCIICVVLACVFGFAGCSSNGGSSSKKVDTGTNSDTGTDTGTDTDSGTNTDTDKGDDSEDVSDDGTDEGTDTVHERLDYFNRIVDEIPTGEYSFSVDVAFSPDGSYGYILTYIAGDYYILVFRTSDRIVVNSIPLSEMNNGSRQQDIAISPDGDYIYVARNYSVLVISTSNFSEQYVIDIEYGTETILFSPDGEYVYAVTEASNIFAIRTSDFSDIRMIHGTGSTGNAAVISPDGRYIYNVYPLGTFYIIDLNDDSVTNFHDGDDFESWDIAMSADGRFIYLSVRNRITCIRASDRTVVDQFDIPDHSQTLPYIAIDTNGEYLYVTDSRRHSVFVLSVSSANGLIGEVVDVIDLGTSGSLEAPIQARGIAIDPVNDFMYISNYGSSYYNVMVVDR